MNQALNAAVWRARWAALGARERRLVQVAGVLVAAALLWWVGLAPALRTLREAPAQHAALEASVARMRALAGQAGALKAAPQVNRDDALRALEASVRAQLGAQGQLGVSGDRATVVLRGVQPQALASWLAQARANAHVLPVQARLTRGPSGWDGSVVLGLPAAP